MRKANWMRFQLVGNSDKFEWKVTGKYQENCLMGKLKMREEKIKVYTYTRVSTTMQVDGYSLDAQKAKMKAYADYSGRASRPTAFAAFGAGSNARPGSW